MHNRYTHLAYPSGASSLCPFARPAEKLVWDEAVRATALFEAVRGVGPIILHRLRREWSLGQRTVNVGAAGVRLPKSQCALFLQALEADGFVRPFYREGYTGGGGRPTVAVEMLQHPPETEEYIRHVGDAIRGSTVEESLFPDLEESQVANLESPSLLQAYVA